MAVLQVRNLEKSYPDFHISLSIDVKAGELLCLLGPSGCGKTTTLRLITGLADPDGGSISLGNTRIDHLPIHRRKIGIVFQDYALFPHMNVFQNIAFGLKMQGKSPRECAERVRELLTLVHLEDYARRKVAGLSGGEQQRVALARALAPHPQLLLLDEPLSALDAKLRKSLRSEIRRIQQELRITTIYVTHDQEEALILADRIAVMNQGNVEQVGPPRTIYENPANRFVASFVGDSNLLPARILSRDGQYARVATSLGEFRALLSQPMRRGYPADNQEGVLLFRPEACRIADPAANDVHQSSYSISGIVDRLEYLGSSTVLTLLNDDSPEIKVKLAGSCRLKPGDTITISVDIEDCILIP